jgi:hypothetical protein
MLSGYPAYPEFLLLSISIYNLIISPGEKMKKAATVLQILIIITISLSYTKAQWVRTGLNEGWVHDISFCGDKLYASTLGGVLVSDNGIDWSQSNWGLLDGDVRAVTINSSRVFAGTQNNGVFMKDLYGLIWIPTALDDERITAMATVGENIFAGTYSSGVYRSMDNGSTWTKINTGLTELYVNCFTVKGTNIFAGAGTKVFMSSNMGTNWSTVSNGLPTNTIISLAVNGADLYAGIWANGIYTSPNDGQGWMSYGQSPQNYISSFAFSGSTMFIAGGKIFKTTIGTSTWTELKNGISSSAQIHTICVKGNALLAGDDGVGLATGLYTSTNLGDNFTSIQWATPNYHVNAIASDGGNLFAATASGIYRSTNNGVDWGKRTIHGDYVLADFSALTFRGSNYVFAGDVNGYCYVSSNSGGDFYNKGQIQEGATVSSYAFISTYVFASTKPYASGVAGGVYMSMDNGATWTAVNNGLPTLADTNTYVNCLAVVGTNLFAGTGHGVYLSTNNGTNWSKINTGLTDINVTSLAVKNSEIFAGTYGGGVFRSNNNGSSWTNANLLNYVTSLFVVDNYLFAGTSGEGVYILKDIDNTWRNVGLQNVRITGFTGSDGKLFAATQNHSVWTNGMDIVTGIEELAAGIPEAFLLNQNFPNPFNPSTTITFELPEAGEVTIKVYNILGQELITLFSGIVQSGKYSVDWNGLNDAGSPLSSGTYLYKLTAGEFTQTRKMILLK